MPPFPHGPSPLRCLLIHALDYAFTARTEPPKNFKIFKRFDDFFIIPRKSVMREEEKEKKKFLVERERERDVAARAKKRDFFSLLVETSRTKSPHASRHNTVFFLLRFNDTHLRHTFCFREPAREREIKRRRNNVRRSRFCSFFSRRSARGVIIINNVSIFIRRTTNSRGTFFFL